MGLGSSKKYLEEISDSDSDSEEEYFNNREPLEPGAPFHRSSVSKDMAASEAVASNSEQEVGQDSSTFITPNNKGHSPVAVANNTTDARARAISMINPEQVLNFAVLREIEKKLDEYEIVSLIFLLTDTKKAHIAVQELNMYLRDGNRKVLTDWAINAKEKWQGKLVEALCIIQNYAVLRELGYRNKTDLKTRFWPQIATLTESINKTQKILYLLCEKFDQTMTLQFLDLVKKEFDISNLPFYEHDWLYLEIYFLDWESLHKDFGKTLHAIKKVLKLMDMEVLGESLEKPIPKNKKYIEPNSDPKQNIKSESIELKPAQYLGTTVQEQKKVQLEEQARLNLFNRMVESESNQRIDPVDQRTGHFQRRVIDTTLQGYVEGGHYYDQPSSTITSIGRERRNSENCYNINRERPGKVLIIDQKYFHTEPDQKYAKLLHKNNSIYKLDTRTGTEKDKKRLYEVFQDKFKFEVTHELNLPHYEMIKSITNFVDSVTDESSIFICILSHGEKGVVYGSNSCWVPVEKIEKIMVSRNKENLKDKPKVLILQSCQGEACQKVEDDNTSEDEDESLYTRDGSSDPKTEDLLKFYATIPGYAAVRNTKNGSWFIQALCNAIDRHHQDEHLLDICTRVNHMVSNKKWKADNGVTNIMMPMLVHTFRKQFYFPESQS